MPDGWIEMQRRRPEIVDAHRIYRWLTAAERGGWASEQLTALDQLLGRLQGRIIGIDAKMAELWSGNEDRIDSLATELLVADHLLAAGLDLVSDPLVAGSRPGLPVNQPVPLEDQTLRPPPSATP